MCDSATSAWRLMLLHLLHYLVKHILPHMSISKIRVVGHENCHDSVMVYLPVHLSTVLLNVSFLHT